MVRYHQSNNTPTKKGGATTRDVIMGRGKRVSEWPGNIFFRQVVNKHREAYAEASRNEKVTVAVTVIKEIHKNKGRFMAEEPNGSWAEIENQRAIEKCCQALREKEKPNTPVRSPFRYSPVTKRGSPTARAVPYAHKSPSKGAVKRKAPPAASRGGVQRKRARTQQKLVQEESEEESSEDESTSGSESSTSGSDDGSSDEESSSDSKSEKDEETADKEPQLMDSAVNRIRWVAVADMLDKLKSFKKMYGHCAVPPEWSSDQMLADWCSAQRQVYRCVRDGYNAASEGQKRMIDALDELEFVWDYDDWHWKHRFDELIDSHKEATESGSAMIGEMSVYWLEDQRRQLLENKSSIPGERIAVLKEAGISLT